MNVIFFGSGAEFRKWLTENQAETKELWVGFYKKSSDKAGITYSEAVDQALCFGWIDGIRKSIDEFSYTNRFTPRKPNSIWSLVNIKRVSELSELGLMQPAGFKAYNERDQNKTGQYSHEQDNRMLDDLYESQLRANKRAWDFFQVQPPWYQKAAKWWIMSAKKEETRLKRLAILIEDSEQARKLAVLQRD